MACANSGHVNVRRLWFLSGCQRGGSVPPSASVLMFWMARVNVAVRDALSWSRAAS